MKGIVFSREPQIKAFEKLVQIPSVQGLRLQVAKQGARILGSIYSSTLILLASIYNTGSDIPAIRVVRNLVQYFRVSTLIL